MTCTDASAASKSSDNRALTPMRRALPSQLPSGLTSGLSLYVPQEQVAQKLWATFLVFQR
jgi:hypothetical protein